MKIYIDKECLCHATKSDNSYREYNVPFFDGKCDAFIEGYRYVPNGEIWVRSDGKVFGGEMITPWKDYSELDAAQHEYEKQLIENYESELTELKSNNEELATSYQEGINSI